MGLTLRELDGQRASFREVLAQHVPQTILVADQAGRCVEVHLFPDGATSWLMRITSADRVLFDCSGQGVASLDDEQIARAIVAAFKALEPEHQPS